MKTNTFDLRIVGLCVASAVFGGACSSLSPSATVTTTLKANGRTPAQTPGQIEDATELPAPDRTEAHLLYDKVIERVLGNNELREHFILKHDQIEGCFIDSEYYLREYDKLLDDSTAKKESGETFKKRSYSTGIYPHLLALHFLTDQVQDQFTYELGRLLEIEEKSNNPEIKNRIQVGFKDLLDYLRYVPRSTILALNPWAEQFAGLHPELANQPDWQHVFRHLAVGDADQIVKLQRDPKVKDHLEHMLAKYAHKPGYATDHVDDLAHTFADYTEDVTENSDNSRKPSSTSTLFTGAHLPAQTFMLSFGGSENLNFAKQVASTLSEKNLKGIFAVSGFELARDPATVNSLKASGMTLANFTYSHPELPRLEDDSLAREVTFTQNALAQATGEGPRWLVPPYGAGYTSPRVQNVAAQSHLKSLFWTVDALDWIDRKPESIVRRVQKELAFHRQGVILFHLAHQESTKAVSQFLNSTSSVQFVVPGDN